MQVENDYDKEIYNGDLGFVRSIDPEASELVIEFDGRPVTYRFGELDEVALAYATTIHKSLGSEYPAVAFRSQRSTIRCCSETCSTLPSPGQAVGRHCRAEEGDGDCGQGEAD